MLNISDLAKTIKRSKILAFALIIIIPSTYLIWFCFINDQGFSTDSSEWGSFGDFIGGLLNPLIALLAFYWLTQSVLIQKTELSETQNVLRETEKAQKEQALTQEKKRFEDTFFSLLDQLNVVHAGLSERLIVRDSLQTSKLSKLHSIVMRNSTGSTLDQRVTKMRDSSSDTSHYFRVLYHILKFILQYSRFSADPVKFNVAITKDVSPTEKFYSNIVRSFLNKEVIQLLAINCIVDDPENDFYKYRQLVERYSLLEHLHIDHEWQKELFDRYDKSAFGARTGRKL
ncbi:putative phage abortive infection protein [Photobacterium damselae subsp. damselae]|uniref:putative phage abortive infection protein n=1 Tax=Photobacterium damselae TaxID=38293 RepID=UPI001F25FDA9|nr:putative phage abortive infection protein [Photobacterium damselae]UJZ92982.1 putative phage abortive infection protein [Photobacterium damselae subsp. damselae]UJZ96965.1 putative phage abortive infection protein [Photobacterium damselae subsp. damselae]